MKILLYVPAAPRTPKLFGRSFQSVMRLEWPSYIDIVIGRNDAPHERKYVDLANKHNHARHMALEGDYDALFLVENDMVLPSNALVALCELPTDVAYGLYCNRHGYHRWLSFLQVDGYAGTSYSQSKRLMKEVWGKVAETKGVGMGCTLIHRNVLEAIEFRNAPNDEVADDWLFSLDCVEHGFKQMHDFGVVCGHIMPDGNVVWPNPQSPGGYDVEICNPQLIRRVDDKNPLKVDVNGMNTVFVYASEEN